MTTTIIPPTCSDAPIWDVWMAAFHAPTLAIADELGVFAALHARAQTADELAATIHVEPRATETIAGLMATLKFLTQAAGRFYLTDVARAYLLPESPYYWGGMLRRIRDTPMECKRLLDNLKRGVAGADARVTGIWQAPQPPPAALKAFTHAMHAHSFALAMRTLPDFGLAGVDRLLDVAGGSGSYSISAAIHDPKLKCTVLDLPAVCEVTRDYAAQYRVGDRVDAVAADMFADAWPTGYPRILFSDIFHDWDDERCQWLANRAAAAIAPGGRVLVHEMLLAETKDGPAAAIAYSMVMIFVAQGRQRSASEIAGLLTNAGLVDVQITMTAGGYALLSAAKPA